MDRVDGEQQRGHQAGRAVHQQAAEAQEEDADGGVEEHIEQVVGCRTQLAQQVVQAKGEHRERPVRFMAPLLCKREVLLPTVFLNKVGSWRDLTHTLDTIKAI